MASLFLRISSWFESADKDSTSSIITDDSLPHTQSIYPCKCCKDSRMECDRSVPVCSYCAHEQLLCFYITPKVKNRTRHTGKRPARNEDGRGKGGSTILDSTMYGPIYWHAAHNCLLLLHSNYLGEGNCPGSCTDPTNPTYYGYVRGCDRLVHV
jgi:hypothetical protein